MPVVMVVPGNAAAQHSWVPEVFMGSGRDGRAARQSVLGAYRPAQRERRGWVSRHWGLGDVKWQEEFGDANLGDEAPRTWRRNRLG